jgi:hypothetical protein
MDRWLGGDWWRPYMAAVDNADPDATNRAAHAIADEYARRMAEAAHCGVATVPMRRSASEKPLFTLMLFHPRVYAKYPFNEAVSNAQAKWRDRMWGLDVERAERELAEDPSLGQRHMDDVRQAMKFAEVQLHDEWVDTIYGNLRRALEQRPSVSMKNDFDLIFNGVVGAARGTHFRKAWDRLYEDGIAAKRVGSSYEYATVVRASPGFR